MTFTLTPLGTAAPHPQPGRPCSGYLVEAGDAKVWMDAGPGTFAELQRHVRPGELTAIWISHLHSDHWTDLIAAEAGISDGGLGIERPIPVYAPADAPRRLACFYGRPDPGPLAEVFAFRPIEDGRPVDLGGPAPTSGAVEHGGPEFTSYAVEHGGIEAYGARIAYDGAVLAYTGDSGPCAELSRLARGADVLLAEAYVDRHEGPPVHLTPEDAAALAREAGAHTLLVTHVGPTLTPDAATARAHAAFGGRTLRAREGVTYEITKNGAHGAS
ncbi:MBL fold metallo-hydrolase [Streptomyces sp. TRM66268-LWL]|uniref:MBL fold metallo-hydrolase n=1 Tax=Streptomyces polyasparticus TaxID=2767826 RepID=A0ABR7SBM0_9ACTN|nr:MBL fold metallo-hydrolase [Streptomyces polyasparticus]MBC9711896.1 MBL fold metallo-hydrolase [Streptomyces polyasparticus]